MHDESVFKNIEKKINTIANLKTMEIGEVAELMFATGEKIKLKRVE